MLARCNSRVSLITAGALAALVLLSGAASARAAGHNPSVGIDSAGNARFAFGRSDPVNDMATRSLIGSTLGPIQSVSMPRISPGQQTNIAVGPDQRSATMTWNQCLDFPFRCGPFGVHRRADGTFLTLSPGSGTQMADDAAGDTVMAWDTGVTCTLETSDALVNCVDLETNAVAAPKVAVAPNGDATFVWATNHTVRTRSLTHDGTLSETQDVSKTVVDNHGAFEPSVGIDAAGNATFLWRRFDGTDHTARTRRRTADGVLGPVHDISSVGRDATGMALAVNATDTAAFAWQALKGGHRVVQARLRRPGDTFTPVKDISAGGQDATVFGDGIDPKGNAVFAWTRSNGSIRILQARQRRHSTGRYRAVQDISAPGEDTIEPGLALAPTGDVVFVWTVPGAIFEDPCRHCTAKGRRLGPGGALGPVLDVSGGF